MDSVKEYTDDDIRQAAEDSLYAFIRLVAPHRVLGHIHQELIEWWTRDDAENHQLTLLPRDHQKSAMLGYRVAWTIVKNPAVTILYISSTSTLAEKQLGFIKHILTSDTVRHYWPELVEVEEGKRSKWTNSEIEVDHPIRKQEGVRDPTVYTAGLTTSITGLHFDIACLDDVVVHENAYTREGRKKVEAQYSLLSSIETTDAEEWVVGTRYHGRDLYAMMQELVTEVFDESGNLIDKKQVYEVFQREVEDRGDGTGQFLWPRQQRKDGKWYGFNQNILAIKRSKYIDRRQFRAQYYNNPNDPDSEAIDSTKFQYYDRKYLEQRGGNWYFKNQPLSIFAAIDFAFSLRSTADYTALVTIGVDPDGNIYVLEIDRFRSDQIRDYFNAVERGHEKWGYRKLRAEVSVAQKVIVSELRNKIKQYGMKLSIDEHNPRRGDGTKEERIQAVLEPRYDNQTIWHYRGGLCQELEDELVQEKPPHDDIKDGLASAVEIAVVPRAKKERKVIPVQFNKRFGGVA